MYEGMLSSMLADQGIVFVSDEWIYECSFNNIELTQTGTEAHNSLGAGESYYAYFRRMHNKLRDDSPNISEEITLALSTNAINVSTGPKGLYSTLLVFGFLPQLPSPSRSKQK